LGRRSCSAATGTSQIQLTFRSIRRKFPSDRSESEYLASLKEIREFAGKAQFVWLERLLDRARLSPLVLMIESANPADQKFARKLLATFSETCPQATRDLARSILAAIDMH
jgi:hypothetical protein